jgi:hypothetical protein
MLAVPRQLHAGVCTALPRHPVMTLHASFFPSSPLARSRLFALLFVPQCSLAWEREAAKLAPHAGQWPDRNARVTRQLLIHSFREGNA